MIETSQQFRGASVQRVVVASHGKSGLKSGLVNVLLLTSWYAQPLRRIQESRGHGGVRPTVHHDTTYSSAVPCSPVSNHRGIMEGGSSRQSDRTGRRLIANNMHL